MTPTLPPADPRVVLAAERTLLAWVRTGLALMGFGFVVARFGLFLRETAALHARPAPQGSDGSLVVGVLLVVVQANGRGVGAHRLREHSGRRVREEIGGRKRAQRGAALVDGADHLDPAARPLDPRPYCPERLVGTGLGDGRAQVGADRLLARLHAPMVRGKRPAALMRINGPASPAATLVASQLRAAP